MPTLFLRLAAVLLLAALLPAQVALDWTYSTGYTVTGTSAKLTLQLPSDATRKMRPLIASAVCPGACTITLSRNGSTATATAGTVVKNRTINPTAQTLVFTQSDSTGGTAYEGIPYPSGGSPVLDLSDMEFTAGERLTIAISSTASQANTLLAKWAEY